jgi:ubiquinone/menaquinone biosynthesis C-methylase UbiE
LYLPFSDETFNAVYCSRGPLSANLDFMKEGYRVLKKGGYLIESTIGERDKLEVDEIFGRGQCYPPSEKTTLEKVRELLDKVGAKMVYSKYYFFKAAFPSIEDVIDLLDRAPIIPDFDRFKDKKSLDRIEKELKTKDGIVLSSHRLRWVARKV